MPRLLSLIIGINKFACLEEPLAGCVTDAERMHAYLANNLKEGYEYLPQCLFDEDATRDEIISHFQEHFINEATKNDICVFYFSGHGGQEYAHPAFKYTERDGYLEGLVCYDSGDIRLDTQEKGAYKLVDKELRYLFSKLSEKGCEIVAIFDCCHSGEIVRHNSPNTTKKTVMAATERRKWEDFLFGELIPEPEEVDPQTIERLIPQGKFVQISACLDSEFAFEDNIKNEGYFTTSLLKVLKDTKGVISYAELVRRIDLNLKGMNITQTPKLYTPLGYRDQQFKRFILGVTDEQFVVGHITNETKEIDENNWIIDLGGMHGVKLPDKNNPENDQIIRVDIGKETIATAYVKEIFPTYSKIAFDEEWIDFVDVDRDYVGRINKLMMHPIYIVLDNNPEKHVLEVVDRLQKRKEELAKDNIFIVNEPEKCLDTKAVYYKLCTKDSCAYLSLPGESYPLTKRIKGSSDAAIDKLVEFLIQISKWNFVKHLQNPQSTYIDNPVRLTIIEGDNHNEYTSTEEEPFVMRFSEFDEHPEDGTNFSIPTSSIKFRFDNNTNKDLYFSCLYLNSQFGVEIDMLDSSVVKLSGTGDGTFVYVANGEELVMELPPYIFNHKLKGETVYLKTIISSEPFSIDIFYLPKLEVTRSQQEVSTAKGFKRRVAPQHNNSWTTQLFTFFIENPYYDDNVQ